MDLFNHFDTFFEKHVKARKDLHIEENFEESDPSFPKDAVLQVLRVIRVVLENCTNKHFYSSYEVSLCQNSPKYHFIFAWFFLTGINSYSMLDFWLFRWICRFIC